MNAQEQIKNYIDSQSEPKRSDIQELHSIILGVMPACKLWFLDGKDSEGKTVSNPNIGYRLQTIIGLCPSVCGEALLRLQCLRGFRGYAAPCGAAAKSIIDHTEKHSFSAHRAAEPRKSNPSAHERQSRKTRPSTIYSSSSILGEPVFTSPSRS